jgi:hypothetical protein
MTNAANFKIAGILAILTILAVMFGAHNALAGFTHVFNLAAVGVFAVASTLGLATRLRA